MKLLTTRTVLLLLLTTLLSPMTYADSNSDFQQGRILFEQGNYQESLKYFLNARNQGMTNLSLYYNLGSTHYKLDQFEQAKQNFLLLTDDPRTAALAHYNLGLIAYKTGDTDQADIHFKKCSELTKSTELKTLASKQIKTLDYESSKPWYGYVYAGYGHDSNITSAPTGVASNQSGSFLKASALFDTVFSGTRVNGITASASLFTKNYLDTSFNDSDSMALSISLKDTIEHWKFTYTAGVLQSTYGSADFERSYRITARASKTLANKNKVMFRYRYENINSLSPEFDHLDGTRHKIRAEYQAIWASDKIKLRFEHETNDRQNSATRNYSPTRNKVSIEYVRKLNASNSISAETSFRNSDYEPTSSLDREDDRITAALEYSYQINGNWKASAKIEYRENESNDPLFDYDKTVTTLSASCLF